MLRNRNELDGLPKQAFAQGFAGQSSGPRLTRSPNWASPSSRSRGTFPSIRLRFEHSLNPIGSRLGWTHASSPSEPGVRLRFLPVGQVVEVTVAMATMASSKALNSAGTLQPALKLRWVSRALIE